MTHYGQNKLNRYYSKHDDLINIHSISFKTIAPNQNSYLASITYLQYTIKLFLPLSVFSFGRDSIFLLPNVIFVHRGVNRHLTHRNVYQKNCIEKISKILDFVRMVFFIFFFYQKKKNPYKQLQLRFILRSLWVKWYLVKHKNRIDKNFCLIFKRIKSKKFKFKQKHNVHVPLN